MGLLGGGGGAVRARARAELTLLKCLNMAARLGATLALASPLAVK